MICLNVIKKLYAGVTESSVPPGSTYLRGETHPPNQSLFDWYFRGVNILLQYRLRIGGWVGQVMTAHRGCMWERGSAKILVWVWVDMENVCFDSIHDSDDTNVECDMRQTSTVTQLSRVSHELSKIRTWTSYCKIEHAASEGWQGRSASASKRLPYLSLPSGSRRTLRDNTARCFGFLLSWFGESEFCCCFWAMC